MFIGCSNYPECEHTKLSINRTKQQLHAPNAGRAIVSAAPVMAKHFTPVIATGGINMPLTFKPIAGECPECHYPLLMKRKARRYKHLCASKQCGKPVRRNNNVNNNLQGDAIAAAIDVLNEERVIAYPTEAVFSGCDPDSETAVMRLLELKRRPVDQG